MDVFQQLANRKKEMREDGKEKDRLLISSCISCSRFFLHAIPAV